MSISAYYITNVLRTYNALLNLRQNISSEEDRGNMETTDVVEISDEGKQKCKSAQTNQES